MWYICLIWRIYQKKVASPNLQIPQTDIPQLKEIRANFLPGLGEKQ